MRNAKWLLLIPAVAACFGVFDGCKKNSDAVTTAAEDTSVTYQVTAYVRNSAGLVQGGATLTLLNPPSNAAKYSTITDSTGKGTIWSPAGAQTLVAKMGSVFYATLAITVTGSSTPQVISTPLTLTQNTSLGKVLVVQADCETLEDVLRRIGFTSFDSTTVSTLRTQVESDSTSVLTYLKNYSLVFSDCNCGDEYEYPLLARTYGRYVAAGGKIYGGHYNYMNLENIYPGYFVTAALSSPSGYDTLLVTSSNLKVAIGSQVPWPSYFTWYQRWTDIPSTSTIYGTEKNTSPAVPIIVENYSGTGKYLWTVYHNQDVIDDSTAIKIVYYFLYAM